MPKQIVDPPPSAKTPPPGFIRLAEFAKNCEVSTVAISQMRRAGKFSRENMCTCTLKNGIPSVYINWAAEGPKYLRSRPRDKWPKWFADMEDSSPPPPPPEFLQRPRESAEDDEDSFYGDGVMDLNTAKIMKERLEIEKRELELQLSKNELVPVHEVAGLVHEIGQTIRQNLAAMVPRLAPILAAEADAVDISRILDHEINDTLRALSKLEKYGR